VLVLWALHRLGLTERLTLGLLVTAVGRLVVPLVLAAVRGVCGELSPPAASRRCSWWRRTRSGSRVSVDVLVAVLGAAMVAMGVRASAHSGRLAGRRLGHGLRPHARAGRPVLVRGAVARALRGVPVLRPRRAFLNVATGLGACSGARRAAGRVQLAGRTHVARADYVARVEPNRSALAWSAISVVVLLLAAGPPLVRSLHRIRNTPGWPFLVGAGVAVAFSILAGWPGAGAEAAWLPYFPWLTVAAVAPTRPGRRTGPRARCS
jgi:hypothetical protein